MIRRAAAPQDVQALAAIHAACFDPSWSPETLRNFIDTASVSVVGDPPTAFLIVSAVLDEAEIITLAVHPSVRQQGLARALLESKMVELAGKCVTRIFLEVATDNLAARHLYKVLGFVQIGLRKAYYLRKSGQVVDALILSRPLAADTFLADR